MLTSTTLTFLNLIMESVKKLDPTLLAFWEGFPCPPPWNEQLLFRLNWTGCVGLEVGEKVKLYMADKCNINHDGRTVLREMGQGDPDDGVLVEEECGLTCQLIIGVMCVLFLVLLLVAVVVCVRRRRSKPSSPSHQSPLTAHPDNAKYYTSCHYACAPVVARQIQTTLNGDRPQTSVVVPGSTPAHRHNFQQGPYPRHNCQQIRPHRHQPPCLIITPYGQVPAHTSTLVVPQRSRYGTGHYRKLDGPYSTSSLANSDRSPVYESIGDTDSIKERGRGRGGSLSECEFCECGGDHSSDQSGYGGGYHDPIVVEDHHHTRAGICVDKLNHPIVLGYNDAGSRHAQDEPTGPCPPPGFDDYYDSKCPQTLPLRPLRNHSEREDNKTSNYPSIEPDELSPLYRKNGGNKPEQEDDEDKLDLRRRPSSGSCYSNGKSNHKDGSLPSQRRVIPALHAHYFVTPSEEIS